MSTRVALVTGASSGIGAASVRTLAAAGFDTIAAARRLDRCEELAREVGGRAMRLDVTDDASVAELADRLDRVDVVVHSAGGALGLDPVEKADLERCAGRCGWSWSASPSGSRKWRRGWSRPSSRSCASAETPSAQRPSIRA